MKTEEFNRILQSNGISVFSIKDAARLIGKPKHYTTVFLKRDRIIKRAANGVYYTPEASNYEIASSIVEPSYISLISALRFYNITEQIFNIIYVLSPVRRNAVYIDEVKIEFIKVKPSLMYGYAKADGAMVAEPEKAIIDMLYLGRFEEYAEEVIESRKISKEKLCMFAELSGNKSLAKRVAMLADEVKEGQ
ncbi:MAG: type IV toxin-antitoxin system AbiEi family antitoxin domain-containing protein [Candidatus Micrarchaeia archaeon]